MSITAPNTTKLADNAFAALTAYRKATLTRPSKADLDRDNTELVAEVVTDLLADLRHLCDELDLMFEPLDEWAQVHYAAEHSSESAGA